MQYTVTILLSLGLATSAIPVELQPTLIRDDHGNMHLVNPDPYSVIDADLEPFFNAEADMVFRLFTRRNQFQAQILGLNNPSSVQSSNFNPAHPTRFTIHGWNADGSSSMHSSIRDNYLTVGEFNVISVDWGRGASTINYNTARNRVAAVGNVISRMINTLVSATGTFPNSMALIGHSLGAHAAGNAGKMQNGRIHTIFGLDPAGPLFSLGHSDILTPNDAQYVEAIFTNAGTLGFNQPLGNSNFYPNGGRSQPGCGIDLVGACAHSRSQDYFAESLTSSVGFRATRCVSHAEIQSGRCTSSGPGAFMGGEPSNHDWNVQGIFAMNTNSRSPFAMG
ncbi:pancreatic lipase-related protein 2-like [Toxorhynchites rutilus septentrionalis]|uniref:pancreatic lipase-related protein 2-like n=1 Tax=Toxorhynchites rutilus septentrionalis TaxID=329112 RepID=UPI00247AA170|nr:pancreatic lipase-related protein 2-like [Toxorhynchites rutilus septentrionalis]